MTYITGKTEKYEALKGGILTIPDVVRLIGSQNSTYSYAGPSTTVEPGLYVFPKQGRTVVYFHSPDNRQEPIQGDKNNDQPVRTNGDFVGRTTGQSSVSPSGVLMIEVQFTQRWYRERYWFFGTKGEDFEVKAWVIADDVELRTAQTADSISVLNPTNPGGSVSPSSDSTDTIMYAAGGVAAVLLLTPKKKRKK